MIGVAVIVPRFRSGYGNPDAVRDGDGILTCGDLRIGERCILQRFPADGELLNGIVEAISVHVIGGKIGERRVPVIRFIERHGPRFGRISAVDRIALGIRIGAPVQADSNVSALAQRHAVPLLFHEQGGQDRVGDFHGEIARFIILLRLSCLRLISSDGGFLHLVFQQAAVTVIFGKIRKGVFPSIAGRQQVSEILPHAAVCCRLGRYFRPLLWRFRKTAVQRKLNFLWTVLRGVSVVVPMLGDGNLHGIREGIDEMDRGICIFCRCSIFSTVGKHVEFFLRTIRENLHNPVFVQITGFPVCRRKILKGISPVISGFFLCGGYLLIIFPIRVSLVLQPAL